MITWLKKKLGIKQYLTCPTCSMVYEPDGAPFDDWCPEHRKPHIELYELEQWAKRWARNHPEEAKKIKAAEEADIQKMQSAYAQELGGALNSDWFQRQAKGLQNNWPLGGLMGRKG